MSEEIGDTIVQSVQIGCGTARPFVCKDPNLTYKQQNRTWKSVSSWTSQPICKDKMFDVFCLLELQMPTPFSHSHGGGGFKKTKCCHTYLGKIPMLTIFSSFRRWFNHHQVELFILLGGVHCSTTIGCFLKKSSAVQSHPWRIGSPSPHRIRTFYTEKNQNGSVWLWMQIWWEMFSFRIVDIIIISYKNVFLI